VKQGNDQNEVVTPPEKSYEEQNLEAENDRLGTLRKEFDSLKGKTDNLITLSEDSLLQTKNEYERLYRESHALWLETTNRVITSRDDDEKQIRECRAAMAAAREELFKLMEDLTTVQDKLDALDAKELGN
jgi:hypothetical protein